MTPKSLYNTIEERDNTNRLFYLRKIRFIRNFFSCMSRTAKMKSKQKRLFSLM